MPASDLVVRPTAGTHIERVHLPKRNELASASKHAHSVTGMSAVAGAVGFRLVAPTVVGNQVRTSVRSLSLGGSPAALVVYGRGLGATVVLEQRAGAHTNALSSLPTATIAGRPGRELDTTPGHAGAVHAWRCHLHRRRIPTIGDDRERRRVASLSNLDAEDPALGDRRVADSDDQERQALVALRDVSKRYGSIVALDGITATVDGRAVGLLGANGAGKSTLMRVMLGLVRPDSGHVRVLGMDVAESPGTSAAGSATCPSTTACRWG